MKAVYISMPRGRSVESGAVALNSAVEQGYKVEPGHILITGALGKLVPGKPGKYVADYGDFGKISFEVK